MTVPMSREWVKSRVAITELWDFHRFINGMPLSAFRRPAASTEWSIWERNPPEFFSVFWKPVTR